MSMEIDEYNSDKKVLPIAGIVLMVIAIISYLMALLVLWVFKNIISYTSGNIYPFLIFIIVVFVTGIFCREIAKRNKYGSWKLIRTSDVLSKLFVVILVLGLFLNLMFP